MKVLDFPLAKITIWFLLGILTSSFWQPSIALSSIILLIITTGFAVLFFLLNPYKKATIYFGIFTYSVSFFIGVTTLIVHTDSNEKSNYTNFAAAFEKPQLITCTLREKLKSNDYNERYIALINSIGDKNYTGKIIVNIQKDNLKNALVIGNIIQAETILQHNTTAKNPNQFDNNKYLANKQIYAQIYIDKAEVLVNQKLKKDIWYYSGRLHARIVHNLEISHFHTTEKDVALALILGQRQEISSEIIKDYQYSGATHILSVSGLHVGFIMLFISFLLKPIPNTRKGSAIKLSVILFSLGLFAIISGLSPSVLRSVTMFSFIAAGNHLRRSGNIYHTLLVSILLILLFEPYFLFDVGFQLSYIALFSILWLQPLLDKLWKPKNKISIYIWNALTVSFAAQIGTFPLCLYYFHQFPGLFFITNIVVIPILSFIMIAGIIVMIIAAFDPPPLVLITVFEKSIYLLNKIIHIIASFESFVVRDISFGFYYLITFYLLIITSVIWLKKPNFTKFVLFLSTIILLQTTFIYYKREIENQQELIVFNIKRKTIIANRTGKNVVAYTDGIHLKEAKNSILNAYLIGNSGQLDSSKKLKNVLFFNGKKILIIDSTGIYENTLKPDILILTQSVKINLDRALNELEPNIVIADGSNSYSLQKLWKYSCIKKNIPFHSTREKGYYKLN